MITNKQLDEIIETIEENLDYAGSCRYGVNCEIYAYVNNKKQVKEYIRQIIEGKNTLSFEQENYVLENGLEKWREYGKIK